MAKQDKNVTKSGSELRKEEIAKKVQMQVDMEDFKKRVEEFNKEFLGQIAPESDLERMLVERLEASEADTSLVDRMESRAEKAESDYESAADELREREEEMESIRIYAKKLYAALELADPEEELLNSDDAELLRA